MLRSSRHLPKVLLLGFLVVLATGGRGYGAVQACAEPQFIVLEPGVVGQPFSLSEAVSCLPTQDSFSNAVVDWGDGTTGPGTISSGGSGRAPVTATHVYAQPGSYAIRISVTDDRTGQTYTGGWHTHAMISATPRQPPEVPGASPGSPSPVGKVHEVKLRAGSPVVRVGRPHEMALAAIEGKPPAGRLKARIDWGDGRKGSGVVSSSGSRITARHRWRRAGRYRFVVELLGVHGEVLARASGVAVVRAR